MPLGKKQGQPKKTMDSRAMVRTAARAVRGGVLGVTGGCGRQTMTSRGQKQWHSHPQNQIPSFATSCSIACNIVLQSFHHHAPMLAKAYSNAS